MLACNVTVFQQQEYLLVGRCITLVLLYGGGAPHLFSPFAINESAIGDIPDQDIREKVKKVCSLFSECTCGSDMLHGSSCCE